ncbi:alpha/beta hydrolase [Neisseria sp.]|uniref:alpha/beta hydrolase n=1 Tax=Neisseria sp. TaxID=192066 RepID=UPI00289DD243|nr:alpha/beta hydrolase [Neisseria sp.]
MTIQAPKNMQGDKKYPAIIVGHPFAAVRQQSANLYAQKMADAGFITLTFDQSFWGESTGEPRGAVLPDVYAENFSAAVDYLTTQNFVDAGNIGIIGVCASGAFSLAAAKIDPRIKAVATSSMYDMGEYFRTGLRGNRDRAIVKNDLDIAAKSRTQAAKTGSPVYGPGQNDKVFLEAKESADFYQTERGKVASNDRRTTPATYAKFLNFYPFNDLDIISPRPILFVVGEIAPSRSFTETAFQRAAQPKELVVVDGANRIDLYDRTEMIPWEKFTSFFNQHLSVTK